MLYNQNWNKSNRISDVLLKAASLLEQHGHAKKTMRATDGSMCAMGALWCADSGNTYTLKDRGLMDDAALAICKALNLQMDRADWRKPPVVAIVQWNNAPERTGQEVIDAMRLAAKQVAEVKENA